ncbi:uncharacterized protein METZ01_LOCUS384215, partial [marine metagenome]
RQICHRHRGDRRQVRRRGHQGLAQGNWRQAHHRGSRGNV